ncbi:M15 family metallopeptidase [Aquirufa regiilacus]|jgi:D-alanyl-D-alanine dipeptidase|uniref:D-alanyl-D-alanine dipeptidase n=1 Tax=Aquirufa regiilacus TaxID=3024868 RepID=A0ABU3TRY9_9BACT|nr:M15 family metallopeptidase [Aquirufa sp. LEOWEIH-7C]MDU0808590.1 M15 family metallopeptidase [Aquirufa sp. LEOWEIH-7C]
MRTIAFLLLSFAAWAQKTNCSYELAMEKQGLVEVSSNAPGVLVELKYGTADNFMGRDVYGCLRHAYVQKPVLAMLQKAQATLEKKYPGYHLLIYDAARPLSIQWVLWNTLTQYPPAERQKYVADPKQHSIHNYGSALDLTVADASGKPLDMGTKYDFFGDLAYPSKEKQFLAAGKLSQKAYQNRLILREAMQSAGFMRIEFEWWHFNAFSRAEAKRRFPVVQ